MEFQGLLRPNDCNKHDEIALEVSNDDHWSIVFAGLYHSLPPTISEIEFN